MGKRCCIVSVVVMGLAVGMPLDLQPDFLEWQLHQELSGRDQVLSDGCDHGASTSPWRQSLALTQRMTKLIAAAVEVCVGTAWVIPGQLDSPIAHLNSTSAFIYQANCRAD